MPLKEFSGDKEIPDSIMHFMANHSLGFHEERLSLYESISIPWWRWFTTILISWPHSQNFTMNGTSWKPFVGLYFTAKYEYTSWNHLKFGLEGMSLSVMGYVPITDEVQCKLMIDSVCVECKQSEKAEHSHGPRFLVTPHSDNSYTDEGLYTYRHAC